MTPFGCPSFQMGGKGINVAKMLKRLGLRTQALCFLGGATGEQCRQWLLEHGFAFQTFPTLAPTRAGLVLRSPKVAETTFLGPDTAPEAEAWELAAKGLALHRQKRSSALALCGSAPGWGSTASQAFLEELETWLEAGLPLWVDSYGPPLAWAVERPVGLIKINAEEFRTLLGAPPDSSVEAGLELARVRWPVQAWVISDGPRPVWFAKKGTRPNSLQAPPIVEVSPTGSGDVLLACLLKAHLQEGKELEEALAFALPLASANAAHPGIAEF